MNHQGKRNLSNILHVNRISDLSSTIACNSPTGHMISPIQGVKNGPSIELNTGYPNEESSRFSGALQAPMTETRQPDHYELLGTNVDYDQLKWQSLSMAGVQDFQTFVTNPVAEFTSYFETPMETELLSMPHITLPLGFPEFCPTVWNPVSASLECQPSDSGYPPLLSPTGCEFLLDQAIFPQRHMAYDTDASTAAIPLQVGNKSFDRPRERVPSSAKPDLGNVYSYSHKDSWAPPIKSWLPELSLRFGRILACIAA